MPGRFDSPGIWVFAMVGDGDGSIATSALLRSTVGTPTPTPASTIFKCLLLLDIIELNLRVYLPHRERFKFFGGINRYV